MNPNPIACRTSPVANGPAAQMESMDLPRAERTLHVDVPRFPLGRAAEANQIAADVDHPAGNSRIAHQLDDSIDGIPFGNAAEINTGVGGELGGTALAKLD